MVGERLGKSMLDGVDFTAGKQYSDRNGLIVFVILFVVAKRFAMAFILLLSRS